MRYSKIYDCSISEGPGCRVSLFLQGCNLHCPGCFNAQTWDFSGGKEFTEDVANKIIDLLGKSWCKGLSILGGEPLSRCNLHALYHFLCRVRETYPEKDIWMWTGHHAEDLDFEQSKVLDCVDALISEPFDKSKKVRTLKYAGSYNQRMWKREDHTFVEVPIE